MHEATSRDDMASDDSPEGLGRTRFRATIQASGKTATGIQVPAEVVAALGPSKRPAVRVTINGYTYRSSVAPLGGVFMVGVSAETRERAGVAAGDEVEVAIERDTEPREVIVPPDFADALTRDADARRFFDGLSYSAKRRHVLAIEGAKTAETRQRRIASAVSTLREGRT
jgi:bifunctional DNA-binding transcriptional regulator/antitoxin component of YhaV-PrlF toxin-antitoxin module